MSLTTVGGLGGTSGSGGFSGPIGVTGTVGVTFGPVGISGVPAVTFGVVGITGTQSVTFGPVGISGVPGVTFGDVGITGPVGVTFPGVTVLNFPGFFGVTGIIGLTGAIGITGPVGVTLGVVSVTFPLVGITGSIGTTFPVGFTGQTNTRPNVSNVTSTVLAANANRKYAYIFNQSGVVVFFKLGTTAVINEGSRLPNNSVFEITRDNLWLGTIDAIKSGGATVQIDIFEGT